MSTATTDLHMPSGLNGTLPGVLELVQAFLQLRAMRSVPENWDGYGADAPRAEAVDAAQAFLVALAEFHIGCRMLPATLVAPTRTGGVLLEWEAGPHQLEVEIEDRDRVTVAYLNTDTDVSESFAMPAGLLRAARFFELATLVFPGPAAESE